jgi:hypothetical protein
MKNFKEYERQINNLKYIITDVEELSIGKIVPSAKKILIHQRNPKLV